MAATKTLMEMVADLRAELLMSVNPASAQNLLPAHKVILARIQDQLWLDHSWAQLRVDRDVTLAAGQRYYDFPADLDMDRVENVWVKWSNRWHRLVRGIDPDAHYNAQNSDNDIRAEPALRWAPYLESQFEIWPIPVTIMRTTPIDWSKASVTASPGPTGRTAGRVAREVP